MKQALGPRTIRLVLKIVRPCTTSKQRKPLSLISFIYSCNFNIRIIIFQTMLQKIARK